MIPLWILRHVRIHLSQKFAIASFLCLSVVMIIMALIRAVLSRYRGWGDLSIQYLLLYVEGCVAISMGSIAAYRSVFVERSKQRELEAQKALEQARALQLDGRNLRLPDIPADTIKGRVRQLRHMHNGSDVLGDTQDSGTYIPRPRTGGAKLDTVRSFIRKIGSAGSKQTSNLDSTVDLEPLKGSPQEKKAVWNTSEDGGTLGSS